MGNFDLLHLIGTGLIGPIVPLQCYNMGHNVHGINLYGVFMIIMDYLHVGDILTDGLSPRKCRT